MLVTLLATALLGADPVSYARPELLLDPGELEKRTAAGKILVLDARTKEAYEKAHVVGAIWIDAVGWSKAFDGGKDREGWARRIGAVGVRPGVPVVVYDDNHSKDAARMWWILQFWGIREVQLLNGGWKGWQEASGKTEKGPATQPGSEPIELTSVEIRLATREHILERLKEKDQPVQLLDARSLAEHCGDEALAKRGGAIPGAKHLEWSNLIDTKTDRFKPAGEMARIFKEAGIDPTRPTITYCQSGGRASVMAFGLELMGCKEARNYYKSWNEWGNAEDTPVHKVQKK